MAVIEIYVKTEGTDRTEPMQFAPDAKVEEVVGELQKKQLLDMSYGDVAVFIEDADASVGAGATLAEAEIANGQTVHVGRRGRTIEANVNYQDQSKTIPFGPGVRLRTILRRFSGNKGFNLSPGTATELVLQYCNSTEQPDLEEHIGSILQPGATHACFDLVAKRVPQG